MRICYHGTWNIFLLIFDSFRKEKLLICRKSLHFLVCDRVERVSPAPNKNVKKCNDIYQFNKESAFLRYTYAGFCGLQTWISSYVSLQD